MISTSTVLLLTFVAFVIYRILLVIYRLFFHPLAKYPGPKLAACTTLYRAYYQVIRDGDHVMEATRLHERYGTVVRVAPNTLHFRNPQAFDDIFKFTSKLTKDPNFYDHLGQSEALFGMPDEDAHKERFKCVADLFSKRFAQTFQANIDADTNRLCDLLSIKLSKGNGAINLARALRAVALDIVQDFVFDFVPDNLRGMKDESFDTLFVDTTWDVMDWTAWCFRNFPLALTLSEYVPQSLKRIILPGEAANIESFNTVYKLVQDNVEAGPKWHRDSMISRMAGKFPVTNLTSECMGTMFGGVINLANMLPFGAFSVSSDPALQEQLYEELKTVWTDPKDPIPSFSVLSELPILMGVVKESLRLMHGIITGPPRLVPEGGAMIDGHFVPEKCVVVTSSLYVHLNPLVFPDPNKFDPSRWTRASPAELLKMSQSLVPFSKGRRMCPGREISIMELAIVLAALFRRFRITPHQTTLEDFRWKVYISLHFTGRFFHAMMETRPGWDGKGSMDLKTEKVEIKM